MLQLENLTKIFNPGTIDQKIALNDISVHIGKGDFVTVIGSNGAGNEYAWHEFNWYDDVTDGLAHTLFLGEKIVEPGDLYDADDVRTAGYLMLEAPLGDALQAIAMAMSVRATMIEAPEGVTHPLARRLLEQARWSLASFAKAARSGRKVRTPQGRMVRNANVG